MVVVEVVVARGSRGLELGKLAFELFLWAHMYASRIKVAIVYAEHSCGTRRYAIYQDDVVCNIYMSITNVHKCRGPAILKWLVSMGKLRKDGS